MNPVIESLDSRVSVRVFSDAPVSERDKATILHSAMRAPTAGNMMLYSIIDVTDQALKDRLADTCDDQPFIATAPLVLLFVADMQKWVDLFRFSNVDRVAGVAHRSVPGPGDLLLSCCDALIAAQNAVVAAESLGIGSCYIGDVLERAEEHAQLFDLPRHTLPIAMLCFGHPTSTRPPTPHYEGHMLHENTYHRLTQAELAQVSADLERMHHPHGFPPGIENVGQHVYKRKFTPEFMVEMNRSVQWWIDRWASREGEA